jgi:hypothetical protein
MQQHQVVHGEDLARAVDAQPWDASVKALTQFPSVLANMDKNLSWTSSLGDAYVNHPQDTMDAVQAMRHRARDAGNLQSTSQQRVTEDASQIAIQPSDPAVVYVPVYDPWIVYGPPLVAWPGWYWSPGLFVPGTGIAFGAGLGIGLFAGFGWGWGHWGCDWGHRTVIYNHNTFVSNGRTFVNREAFARERLGFAHGLGMRGGDGFGHEGGPRRPGDSHAGTGIGDGRGLGGDRGSHAGGFRGADAGVRGRDPHAFAAPREVPEGRWSAFSGFDHGAATRGFSARGSSSFGDLHGGGFGGGGHGGGFGGGFGGHGGGHR